MLDASTYLSDPHKVYRTTTSASKGDIVVYYNLVNGVRQISHSAIVVKASNGVVTCKSKWGASGVYEHTIDTVPASYYAGYDQPIFAIYTRIDSHSLINATGTATNHTGTCTICEQTITEVHTLDSTGTKCSVCGYENPSYVNYIKPVPLYE